MRSWLAVAVLLAIAVPALGADPAALAREAYDRKDWAACAKLYAEDAARPHDGLGKAFRYQAAACCAALGGDRDEAFRLLGLSAERGLRDPKQITEDDDLASLHADPRWAGVVATVTQNGAAFLKTFKDPALRAEILAMAEEDQAVRRRFMAGNQPTTADREKAVAADERHTARMKQIVAAHGWPGKSLVGEDGAKAAWLLVQHADRDRAFQKQCLALIEKAVKAGEASGKEFAYLTDRLAVAEGRKQVYGLMFQRDMVTPEPMEDEEHVDERRSAVGLPPMAEYRKQMQEMYGPR